jgi:hypothetical protein
MTKIRVFPQHVKPCPTKVSLPQVFFQKAFGTPTYDAGERESERTQEVTIRCAGNLVFFLRLLVVGPGSLFGLRGKGVRIQIAPRKNDADFQVFPFDLAVEGGGSGHGA